MELSAAAMFLNSFFAGYDKAILTVMHALSKAGAVLTPLMKLITLLGEKGIIFFLLALLCICFPKTRKFGVCVFGAVCCGALITNIILKDAVARPRPFESVELFRQWWQSIGAPAEDGFSFPSGHATAAAAGMTAIRLMKGKKWTVPALVWVLLMMISRNYLMAHYPSDVLVGALIGVASGFIAFFIARLIFDLLEKRNDIPLFDLLLHFNVKYYLPAGIADRAEALVCRIGAEGTETEPEEESAEEEAPSQRSAVSARRAAPARRAGSHSAPTAGRSTDKARLPKINIKSAANVGYKGKHEKR